MQEKKIALNAEREKAINALKTGKGQIEGIIKMIEDGRYCIDISNQIMAAQSLLKKANKLMLAQHLHSCVIESVNNEEAEEKIDEVLNIFNKLIG